MSEKPVDRANGSGKCGAVGQHGRRRCDKDYDILYFDDSDLSWEAEDAAIRAGRL